jgi:hypothetical protein
MKKLILIAMTFVCLTNETKAQTWESIPLPPGVTQLNDPNFTAGGNYAYSTTNFGANLYRFNGTTWGSIPLPPGVTQLDDPNFTAGGNYAYSSTNFGANLYRFNGTTWESIPLPPGVTQLDDPNFTAGGNYAYSSTNFGANLYRYSNIALGINQIENNHFIVLFPNPATNQISINIEAKRVGSNYYIYDVQGRIILSGKLINENTIIDLNSLTKGSYILGLNANLDTTFKFIKE